MAPPSDRHWPVWDQDDAQAHVRGLLRVLGEDPTREGLEDTPKRVIKSLVELTSGYQADPAAILARTFDLDDDDAGVRYGGLVLLRDIEFHSLCEHHMLPFSGVAHVAYLPGAGGRVVGISKLARLVEAYARRLQVQERLTAQVADAIEVELGAAGVLVVIEAAHYCMRMRGVNKQQSVMTTSEVRGLLATDAQARTEALSLIRGGTR